MLDRLHREWGAAVAKAPQDKLELIAWLEGSLKSLYPFQAVVMAYGELVAGQLTVTHMFAHGHSDAYVAQLAGSFDLQQRGALKKWFSSRQPIFIDADDHDGFASDFEIKEMKEFGFKNVAGHGVLNARSNAGTYFGFANTSPSEREWQCQTLSFIAPHLNSIFLNYIAKTDLRPQSWPASLTSRQTEIVRLLAAGLNDKRIALQLGLSEKTIRNQLTSIYSTLGIHKRTELIAYLK